jgi:glycosyltransferase involved in cell wall biosynthesis
MNESPAYDSGPRGLPRLVYVSRQQFGYMLPTYHNVRYLRDDFDIEMVTLDHGKERVELSDVQVTLGTPGGSARSRFLDLVKLARQRAAGSCALVLVEHFPGCSPIAFAASGKPSILDIRSGSTATNPVQRELFNAFLQLESLFFDRLSIISASLRERLLPAAKLAHVIPLGAEPRRRDTPLALDELRLIYVGTLFKRRIEDTIKGLKLFLDANPASAIRVRYDIVGDGYGGEREMLTQLSRDLGIGDVVQLHGFVHHKSLGSLLDQANVGVSYIPKTYAYDVQPPTKTYEYILSGIPAIATSTTENCRVINDVNGVLIEDDPKAFAQGLARIYERREHYDSFLIRQSCREYSWEAIIHENMTPFLWEVMAKHAR